MYAETNTVEGYPSVESSATIILNGERLMLWGIKPLAPDQQCWEDGVAWHCGEEATMALRHFVYGRQVTCELYPPLVENSPRFASCVRTADSKKRNLSAFLVVKGFAMDAGGTFHEQEQKARARRRGIWSGKFQSAEDWENGVQTYMNDMQTDDMEPEDDKDD